MEELPICTLSTNKLRQRRAQSELLHASSASSSPASALTKERESQVTHMRILAASEGTPCEKHTSFIKEMQQPEPSSCTSSLLEKGDDAEDASMLEHIHLQDTSTQMSTALSGVDDTEEVAMIKVEPQDMLLLERTHFQETLTKTSTALCGVDDPQQAVIIEAKSQEGSMHVSIFSEIEDYAQCTLQQNNEELQASFSHVLSENRTEDHVEQATQHMKGTTVSEVVPTQIWSTIKESEGMELAADDTEHVLEMRNMGSQEISACVFSSSQRTSDASILPQKNAEQRGTSTHTTMVEMSLRQHLQQDDAAKEEAAMRSFIMRRFLPAAEEVAAEHESSIACLVSENHLEAPSPSLPQQPRKITIAPRMKHSGAPSIPSPQWSQTTPSTRRLKSRSRQAPRGFSSSRPLHSCHQEDVMPFSVRSCGFFCLGLKTAIFRAHRTVSASACSRLRKKSWASHSSNHTKVSDEGASLIGREMEGPAALDKEAVRGATKKQSLTNTHASVSHCIRCPNSANILESPRKHAMKYDDSRRGCRSSDGCANVGCDPSFSQSCKSDLVGNQFENMKLMQSPDDLVMERNFVSAALKEQDSAMAPEGVVPCDEKGMRECKSSCNCCHVKTPPPHNLVGEGTACGSTLQELLGGLQTNNGKPAHGYVFRIAQQDGDEEDDEPQFFDALSRLNSVKSNATFYGSPSSECEGLGFEGEWVNDEGGFTDASSHFETPRASVSRNKSGLSHICTATEKGMTGKVSSLSRRVGKGLKLETESKQAKSPTHKHNACAYEQKLEPKQAERHLEHLPRLRDPSWDRMSDLYASKASTISPVFPAKCQNNTPNSLGWPFGISTYRSSRAEGSPNHVQQEKSIEKYVVCGDVPSPPLPPTPTESWLEKAVAKNASRTSPLATLRQKEKITSARKKLDFISASPDAQRSWENVVKESQVQVGHLRFSEELHQHHPSNLNAIKPLKL